MLHGSPLPFFMVTIPSLTVRAKFWSRLYLSLSFLLSNISVISPGYSLKVSAAVSLVSFSVLNPLTTTKFSRPFFITLNFNVTVTFFPLGIPFSRRLIFVFPVAAISFVRAISSPLSLSTHFIDHCALP